MINAGLNERTINPQKEATAFRRYLVQLITLLVLFTKYDGFFTM